MPQLSCCLCLPQKHSSFFFFFFFYAQYRFSLGNKHAKRCCSRETLAKSSAIKMNTSDTGLRLPQARHLEVMAAPEETARGADQGAGGSHPCSCVAICAACSQATHKEREGTFIIRNIIFEILKEWYTLIVITNKFVFISAISFCDLFVMLFIDFFFSPWGLLYYSFHSTVCTLYILFLSF